MTTQTPESTKFIASLKTATEHKWLNVKTLSDYLDANMPQAKIYGVMQINAVVTPVEIVVTSFTEIIKNAEIVDLKLMCYSERNGETTKPFELKASSLMPKDYRAADVTRINYQQFTSFSRAFNNQTDRDDYLEEITWLSGMLDEMSASMHDRQIGKFLKYIGGGGLNGFKPTS